MIKLPGVCLVYTISPVFVGIVYSVAVQNEVSAKRLRDNARGCRAAATLGLAEKDCATLTGLRATSAKDHHLPPFVVPCACAVGPP